MSQKIFEYAHTGNQCLNHKAHNIYTQGFLNKVGHMIHVISGSLSPWPDSFYTKWFNMPFFPACVLLSTVPYYPCTPPLFAECLFALMPLTNLYHFSIYASSFSV